MGKGMFTELMEAAQAKDQAPQEQPQSGPPKKPSSQDDMLPGDLEDISQAGYTSHSYRFTEAELRWLRRFCLRASERIDRRISHNTLIRLLLRLADDEWKTNPDENRLLDLLSRLKD